MAVSIGFTLAGPGDRYFIEPASVVVSADRLRYGLFVGDVKFVVGGCTFETKWGWVPVLDFAAAMAWVLNDLTHAKISRFEFTESNATIDFRREGNVVHVSPSYVMCVGVCSFHDLEHEIGRFVHDVLTAVRAAAPSVAQTPPFLALEQQMLIQVERT